MTVDHLSDASQRVLPEGVVTFLFTDIEGSTKLLHRLGDEYRHVLSTHHRIIREAIAEHDGHEVDTEGDAFFVAFSSARQAVATAVDVQRAMFGHPWEHGEPVRVRMGLHTGEPLVVETNYVGMDVHRAARICSAAHGGQVLVSARLHELVGDRVPDGVSYVDMGEHRLKDLPQPERLLQLRIEGLPETFPPLRSLQPPTNLPHHAGALLGRQTEIDELRDLLLRSESRLVTITGPGGVGKTRVAAAAALGMAAEFPRGAFFVDLTPVRAGERVLPEVARVLELPLDGAGSALRALAGYIDDARMLLVLDNFEQVLGGAVAVGQLLESCPGLRVLVTSRVLLDLLDEQEFALGPMGLPVDDSLAAIGEAEAVQLFVERAKLVRRDFRLTEANANDIAELVELLDGLPLAIELAASRTRVFPPGSLLARLDDRLKLLTGGSKDAPERHRTLRATIDWSYDLLQEDERQLFRDLAVFDGGARFDSIEAVSKPGVDVLEPLTSLVSHSLLRQREDDDGEPRFVMLKTIQEYAAGLLDESPDYAREIRERHAEHYLWLVEDATLSVGGRTDVVRLEPERDNVRSALSLWLDEPAEQDDGVKVLRLATGMAAYWYPRGLASEGELWLERAVAAASEAPLAYEARALRMLGVLTEQRREYDRAAELLERALELYQRLGDADGEARSLNSLGVVARSVGKTADGEQYLLRAVAIRERIGDTLGVTTTRNNLGIVYLDQERWEEAKTLFVDNLARDRVADDSWGAACSSLNLGFALLLAGQPDDAARRIRTAIEGFVEVLDPDGGIEALETAIGVGVLRGDMVTAARMCGATDALRLVMDQPGTPADQAKLQRWLARCQEALGAEAYEASRQEGSVMTYEQAIRYALDTVLVDRPA